MDKIEKKREKEKAVVKEMIYLYCRKNHKIKSTKGYELCEECKELSDYAAFRSDKCPFMENKTFCVNCRVHCYKPEMRERIRRVMRFSGPRMMLYHPGMAMWHLICAKREKKKVKDM